jgi:hypothetical protein
MSAGLTQWSDRKSACNNTVSLSEDEKRLLDFANRQQSDENIRQAGSDTLSAESKYQATHSPVMPVWFELMSHESLPARGKYSVYGPCKSIIWNRQIQNPATGLLKNVTHTTVVEDSTMLIL